MGVCVCVCVCGWQLCGQGLCDAPAILDYLGEEGLKDFFLLVFIPFPFLLEALVVVAVVLLICVWVGVHVRGRAGEKKVVEKGQGGLDETRRELVMGGKGAKARSVVDLHGSFLRFFFLGHAPLFEEGEKQFVDLRLGEQQGQLCA